MGGKRLQGSRLGGRWGAVDALGHSLIGSGDLKQEGSQKSRYCKEGPRHNVMELNSLAS